MSNRLIKVEGSTADQNVYMYDHLYQGSWVGVHVFLRKKACCSDIDTWAESNQQHLGVKKNCPAVVRQSLHVARPQGRALFGNALRTTCAESE